MDLELHVERIAAGGDGIARQDNGRVVFVHGGLPGETVRVTVDHEARDFAKAHVVEVIDPVAARVAPPCPYVAAGCGGCGWQHVEPSAQLALKVDIVRDALARQGRLRDAEVVAGGAVSPFAYRTTLRLAVLADGRVGWHAGGSHRLVGVDHCLVAHPSLDELIEPVRVTGADELLLRCGVATGERLAWAIGEPQSAVSGLPMGTSRGERAVVHEDVAGHRFQVSAPSFFQSSPDAAELLVEAVRAAAQQDDPVERLVDLYAGVGLFAATIEPEAEVICVERSGSATRDARTNLRGRAAMIIEDDVQNWSPVVADLVIADPARTGLDRTGVAAAAGTDAPVIVLVSCDAAALGRDARLLGEAGWRHAGSTVIDAFPQTPHVEVVTRFERS